MEITQNEFEEIVKSQATKQEIINFYNGDTKAIENFCKKTYNLNFETIYKKLIATQKIDLRKKLLSIATDPHATVSRHQLTALVWTCKVYLGLNEEKELSKGNMSDTNRSKNHEEQTDCLEYI